jgi:hypothetical protein
MSSTSTIASPPLTPEPDGERKSTINHSVSVEEEAIRVQMPSGETPSGAASESGSAGAARRAAGAQVGGFSCADAEELAARRTAEAKLEARLRGWKPLTLWYAFWAIVIAIGSISSLGGGHVGAFFIGAALTACCLKYTHYLYNGGRRRVWFFIW